jgi:hypothetical protein
MSPQNKIQSVYMIGKKYGKLTVISQLPSRKKRTVWQCVCDCGGVTEASSNHLRNGAKKSCGCLKRPNLFAKKVCPVCKKTFYKDPRNTWAYWEKAKYCSAACFGIEHSRNAVAKRKPIEEEFAKHFKKTDGCWEWTSFRDKDGYGLFSYAKKMYRAHVLALKFDGRPVEDGQFGCHHCDNPCCVRPDHLYPGTQKQNMTDARSRNRVRIGEQVHAAKLTAEDVRKIRMSSETCIVLGARYGVAGSNISMIRSRRTWKHVT